MPYKVAIRKNETGEVRLYNWSNNNWHGASDKCWWSEGNGGCDCNREIFFENHNGKESHCSEGRFSILYVELPDGTKIEDIDGKTTSY